MKCVLRISSKSIITTFQSGMHMFGGCFSFLIQVVSSCGLVFRKCNYASQLGSKVKEIGIWVSAGTILTFWQEDMFGPSSTSYITVGKGGESSFNYLSLNLSLPSMSSTVSVWSLLLDSLEFLSVRNFHNTKSECSFKSSY